MLTQVVRSVEKYYGGRTVTWRLFFCSVRGRIYEYVLQKLFSSSQSFKEFRVFPPNAIPSVLPVQWPPLPILNNKALSRVAQSLNGFLVFPLGYSQVPHPLKVVIRASVILSPSHYLLSNSRVSRQIFLQAFEPGKTSNVLQECDTVFLIDGSMVNVVNTGVFSNT